MSVILSLANKCERWKRELERRDALAEAARQGGDVKQAPGEGPQSGGDSRNAQNDPHEQPN